MTKKYFLLLPTFLIIQFLLFPSCNRKENNEQEIKPNHIISESSSSVESVIALPKDLRWIYNLIKEQIVSSNSDKAILYADELIARSQKIKDKNGEECGYYLKGFIYDIQKSTYDKALDNYTKALEIQKTLHYSQEISDCLLSIGGVYYKLKFYDKALIYYQELIKNIKETHNKKDEADAYRGIALVYRANQDYIQSIYHLEKCLSIQQELNNEIEIGNCYNSLASTYYTAGNYQKANEYYLQAATLFKLNNKNQELGNVYYNLGLLHVEMKEILVAKTYFNQSLNIGNTYQYSDLISSAELQLGKLAASSQNYTKAIHHGVAALQTARLQNDLVNLENTSLFLSNLYESTGNSKQALAYLKESTKWKDAYQTQQASIHNQLEDQRVAVMNWQASLKTRFKPSSPISGWIIAIGMLLFLIGNSYFFWYLSEKRKAKKEAQENLNQENDPEKISLQRWQSYQLIGIQKQLKYVKEIMECLEKEDPLVQELKGHIKEITWFSHLSDEINPNFKKNK